MIPCWRIDSTSSPNASAAKVFRGWSGLGTIIASSTWWIFSPGSASSRMAEGRVLINALRPLPRADFAMFFGDYRFTGDQANQDASPNHAPDHDHAPDL